MKMDDKKAEWQKQLEEILLAVKGLEKNTQRLEENQSKTFKDFYDYIQSVNSYLDGLSSRVSSLEERNRESLDKTDYLQSQIDSIAKKVEEMRNGSDCISRRGKICAIRKEPLYDYAEQIGLDRRDVLNILEYLGMLRVNQSQRTRTSNVRPPHSNNIVRAIKVYFDD